MASPWRYDPTARRYRYAESGRAVPTKRVDQMREELVAGQERWARNLAASLAEGGMSVAQFEQAFRERIKRTFVAQMLLGRGGRNAWTNADRGAVGAMIKEQYRFARQFSQDIAGGTMTRAQIERRAQQYFQSSRQAFERGRTNAYGMPRLERYPCDGSTACKAGCKCSLVITETDEAWEVTWRTSADESCDDCAAQASAWSPLRIEKKGQGT